MAQTTEQWRSTIAALWDKQSQWSKAADIHKASQGSWTGPLIVIGFIGVILSTVSPYVVASGAANPKDWALWRVGFTLLGPLLVTVAAILTREVLGPRTEQKWIKAREVAEALKAEGYIFAAGAPPYSDPATAPALLAEKLDGITATGGLGEPLPPAKPKDVKRPYDAIDIQEYITRRLDDQRAFHDRDAREYAAKLATWRRIAIGLMVVSGALGVIAGVLKQASFNVWIAVVSTALATITAYVHASRFEFLAATYAATSERLQSLKTAWGAKQVRGPAENDRFVLDCEGALAAQNRMWSEELSKRVSERLKAAAAQPAPGPNPQGPPTPP